MTVAKGRGGRDNVRTPTHHAGLAQAHDLHTISRAGNLVGMCHRVLLGFLGKDFVMRKYIWLIVLIVVIGCGEKDNRTSLDIVLGREVTPLSRVIVLPPDESSTPSNISTSFKSEFYSGLDSLLKSLVELSKAQKNYTDFRIKQTENYIDSCTSQMIRGLEILERRIEEQDMVVDTLEMEVSIGDTLGIFQVLIKHPISEYEQKLRNINKLRMDYIHNRITGEELMDSVARYSNVENQTTRMAEGRAGVACACSTSLAVYARVLLRRDTGI